MRFGLIVGLLVLACGAPARIDTGDAGAGGGGENAGGGGASGGSAGGSAGGGSAGGGSAGGGSAGGGSAGGGSAGGGSAGGGSAGGGTAGGSAGGSATGGGAGGAGGGMSMTPDAGATHVHIFIDNFCNTSVSPSMINASLSTGVMLQFHNHSVDYEADVWSSRNYGYLQLARGATWNDPIMHCRGPNPFTEYFDVSIAGGGGSACPGVRFTMHCQ